MEHCRTCHYWGTPVTRLSRGEIQVAVCSYVYDPSTPNFEPLDVRVMFKEKRVVVGDGDKPVYTAEGFGCTKHEQIW